MYKAEVSGNISSHNPAFQPYSGAPQKQIQNQHNKYQPDVSHELG
jgi:hypothetical protein